MENKMNFMDEILFSSPEIFINWRISQGNPFWVDIYLKNKQIDLETKSHDCKMSKWHFDYFCHFGNKILKVISEMDQIRYQTEEAIKQRQNICELIKHTSAKPCVYCTNC